MYPSYEEAARLAQTGEYDVIPLSAQIYADSRTPIEVLRILKHASSHCYILESVEKMQKWGRYTFLGYDPVLELTCKDHELTIRNGSVSSEKTDHPGKMIREILKKHRSPRLSGLPTFTGGFVGYFSYDYIKYSEPSLKLDAEDEENFRDVDLMLFDKVIAFDNYKQKIILIVNLKIGQGKDFRKEYERGTAELEEMARLILHGEPEKIRPLQLHSEFRNLFDKEQYCDMVEKGKHHIKEGDIFQVVLSNRLEADIEGSLFDTYRVLRTTNPSPYMFYFSSDDIEIAGASPETLVKLENGKLYTYPLAGTRPRGRNEAEDLALEKELLADEKERAEHNMLVDLGRNDIGKISRIGSVRVEQYMNIERYSQIGRAHV